MPAHGGLWHAHGSSAQITTEQSLAWETFECGRCGNRGPGAVVVRDATIDGTGTRWIRCGSCGGGSVIDSDQATSPGVPFGPKIIGLPDEVEQAYLEARRCMSVGAYSAAELICRKILMHVAVDRTPANEGETFASYIDALIAAGYITPPMKSWVDLIRTNANETTHHLPAPDRARAEGTVSFTAQLLRVVYEMEHLAATHASSPPESQPA